MHLKLHVVRTNAPETMSEIACTLTCNPRQLCVLKRTYMYVVGTQKNHLNETCMLWVLIWTISMRWFSWAPKIYMLKLTNKKIFSKFVKLDLPYVKCHSWINTLIQTNFILEI